MQKVSQRKEKSAKNVKSIIEIFETINRGNKMCRNNEEKFENLKNSTQANTVKNDRIEGDGFARIMKNIQIKLT